jgi:uncharacterized protein YndB with AHSA1/START domain
MLNPMRQEGRFSRTVYLRAPIQRVWEALTEGRQLSAWFGAVVEVEPRPAGSLLFRWPDGRERRATIEELAGPRILSFRWAPFERTADGRPRVVPASRVEFSLRGSSDGTTLTVTEEVLGGHPAASALPK